MTDSEQDTDDERVEPTDPEDFFDSGEAQSDADLDAEHIMGELEKADDTTAPDSANVPDTYTAVETLKPHELNAEPEHIACVLRKLGFELLKRYDEYGATTYVVATTHK